MFLPKKVLAISSIEAFLQKTSGSLHTHPHRAKAGWIHLNFSTSSRANWWGGRGARNWEWKCETREKQADGFLSGSNHSRWIFFQEQIFPSGFLSKIKYFMVEFFSRWIFQLESFKMDFFLRSDGFSFQVHIVNLTSFKVERWIHFWRELYR